MKPAEVLEALYLVDNHQAWKAAWEIIRSNNEVVANNYVPEFDSIKRAVGELCVPKKPALRDSRDAVWLAVEIIEALSNRDCRCVVYPSSNQVLPENHSKWGLVEIIDKRVVGRDLQYDCKCSDCGQRYTVTENRQYHYPVSDWVACLC